MLLRDKLPHRLSLALVQEETCFHAYWAQKAIISAEPFLFVSPMSRKRSQIAHSAKPIV